MILIKDQRNQFLNKQENCRAIYEPRREDDLNGIKEKFKEINLKLENLQQNVSSLVKIIRQKNQILLKMILTNLTMLQPI